MIKTGKTRSSQQKREFSHLLVVDSRSLAEHIEEMPLGKGRREKDGCAPLEIAPIFSLFLRARTSLNKKGVCYC